MSPSTTHLEMNSEHGDPQYGAIDLDQPVHHHRAGGISRGRRSASDGSGWGCADEDASREAQVPVEPRIPKATAIRLCEGRE